MKLRLIHNSLETLKTYYWSKEISFFVVDNTLDVVLDIDNFEENKNFHYHVIGYHELYVSTFDYVHENNEKNKETIIKRENGFSYMYYPITYEQNILGGLFFIIKSESSSGISDEDLNEYKFKAKTMVKMVQKEILNSIQHHKTAKRMDFYDMAFDHMNVGILISDKNSNIKYFNQVAFQRLRLNTKEGKSMKLKDLFNDLSTYIDGSNSYRVHKNKLCKTNNNYYNLLMFPIDEDDLSGEVGFVIEDIHEASEIERGFEYSPIRFQDIIGEDSNFIKLKEFAKSISDRDADILILGESGTGKELFARAIHNASRRRKGPFIAVNCSAIPNDLLESEFFGYDSGAFTGASKSGKSGKFELANGGTIFLDEIGDMSLYMQAKILRVVQERVFERVGGIKSTSVDIRIIAATNKNLKNMVKEGSFREDLYYRLNVIPILLPPIRERKGDKNLFINYYINKYSKIYENQELKIDAEALKILLEYDWPGNVREIENTIQFLCCINMDGLISERLVRRRINLINNRTDDLLSLSFSEIIPLEKLEKIAIKNALNIFGYDAEGKKIAAERLGIGKSTLYKKLKEYKISDEITS